MPSQGHLDKQSEDVRCGVHNNIDTWRDTHFAFREEYDFVEHVEYLESWLVDGEHNRSVGVCQTI